MTLKGSRGKWGAVALVAGLLGCPGPETPDGGGGGGTGTAGGMAMAGGIGGGAAAGGSAGGAAPFIDLDFVAVRLNDDGTLDTTFGDGGITKIDVGAGTTNGNRELLWSVAKDSTDRLLLFGSAKAVGRADNDRVILRLEANGARDLTFAGTGLYRFDLINGPDNARHGYVQPDGKIMWAGYSVVPNGTTADGGPSTTNRGVVIRLDPNGAPDPAFGDAGVALPLPAAFERTDGGPSGFVEPYAAVLTPGGRYLTTGYGRIAATGTVDMISLRLEANGALDTTWSMNLGYHAFNHLQGDDRGRNITLLPDGRPAIVGSVNISSAMPPANVLDAYVQVLTADGALDTSFNAGMGYRTFNFMGADEVFYGVGVTANGMQLAAAGWSGGGANANEDATLVLIPLMVGAPAEFAQKVPLSATGNDRFWALTTDAMNRVVAVGMVNVGGDTRFAIARFTPLGAFDATFGGGTGIVTLNVAAGGADETARSVVVQSNGKIVVAGVADH